MLNIANGTCYPPTALSPLAKNIASSQKLYSNGLMVISVFVLRWLRNFCICPLITPVSIQTMCESLCTSFLVSRSHSVLLIIGACLAWVGLLNSIYWIEYFVGGHSTIVPLDEKLLSLKTNLTLGKQTFGPLHVWKQKKDDLFQDTHLAICTPKF